MSEEPRWPHDGILHAWWADPDGRLLAGEYPGYLNDVRVTRQKLGLLAEAGIGTIIDLTDANDRLAAYHGHLTAVAAERGVAMQRLSHPIPDVSVTTPEHYDEIIADIEKLLADGQKIYIHCWGGVGRTGTVVGCWHVHRGLSPTDALRRIAAARAGTRKAHRAAPETPSQIEMLHELQQRRQSKS